MPNATGSTVEERFWAKVDKTEACWNWTGSTDAIKGYGYFNNLGKIVRSHRLAYLWEVGPLEPGMQVDHRCFNHACVNPSHLRSTTQKQNQEHRAGAQSNSKSGVRGVTWHGRIGKWQATVGHNKHQYHVGYYDTVEAAEGAVIAKRLELFTHNDVDRR